MNGWKKAARLGGLVQKKENSKKRVVKVVLACLLVCLVAGCASKEESVDPIVGQWIYEGGNSWYLILENGDVFEIGLNDSGQHMAIGVYVHEDGDYTTVHSWYKEDGEYYWKANTGGAVKTVHIDGDTLVISDIMFEWYRVPETELIPLDEIYYFTLDMENMTTVLHPLSELIGE